MLQTSVYGGYWEHVRARDACARLLLISGFRVRVPERPPQFKELAGEWYLTERSRYRPGTKDRMLDIARRVDDRRTTELPKMSLSAAHAKEQAKAWFRRLDRFVGIS